MTSGRLAGETVIKLKRTREPCTAANLAAYRKLLDDSFVMKDMKKYRKIPDLLHNNHQFMDLYPRLLSQAAQTLFRVDGVDKRSKERDIMRTVRSARGLRGLLGDVYRVARAWR
jgi:electron transfer flavoprotein-quinone oxidoreductase